MAAMAREYRFVGVLYESMAHQERRILQGVVEVLSHEAGWVIVNIHPRQVGWLRREYPVDAVLLMSLPESDVGALRRFEGPVVHLSNVYRRHRPDVVFDDEAIGRLGAQYYLERGLRSFAFVGNLHTRYAKMRLKGFRDELASVGHECRTYDLMQERRPGADSLPAFLRTLPNPVAVLTSEDASGWHVVCACRLTDLQVPTDVAVLGVDNNEMVCQTSPVPLSSVSADARLLGRHAAEMIRQQLLGDGEPVPVPVVLPPGEIITRASTDLFAIDDAEICRALHFLHANATRPLTVDELAYEAALPRAAFYSRFRRAIVRTPLQELTRLRLARARALLSDPSRSIRDVAAASGFSGPGRLQVVFKEHFSETPREFRRRITGSASGANRSSRT
jgi:LacI family transcriptional regulator